MYCCVNKGAKAMEDYLLKRLNVQPLPSTVNTEVHYLILQLLLNERFSIYLLQAEDNKM